MNLFAIWKDCSVPKTIDIQVLKCLAIFIAVFLASLETLLMSFAHSAVNRSQKIADDLQISHLFPSSCTSSFWSRNNGGGVVFPGLERGFAGLPSRALFPPLVWAFEGLTALPSLSHIPNMVQTKMSGKTRIICSFADLPMHITQCSETRYHVFRKQ